MTGNLRRQLGLAIIVALCVGSLGLPLLYGRWSDHWLQARGGVRAVQQGELSEEGQKNPLVYALYRNRFLTTTAMEMTSDAEQTREDLQVKTQTLREAGALSREAAQRAQWILRQPTEQTSSKAENGFVSATYWVPDDENGNGGMVQAAWQERTGFVTFYSVTISTKPASMERCLDAYRSYLGVEALPGWTEINEQESGVCRWSPAGQLYLYYTWEGNAVRFGAVSRDIETEKAVT